jgi:hypothetical protein
MDSVVDDYLNAAGVERQEEMVSSRGVKAVLSGVSPLLLQLINDSFKEERPEPQPPTYTAEIGGDGENKEVEHLPHDETTLETEEEWVAWRKYKAEKAEWDGILNTRVMRAMVVRGASFPGMADDGWASEHRFMGLTVPDDPAEKKYYYYQTEFVGHPSDMINLMGRVMRLSGMNEEAAQVAENLFRRAAARSIGDAGRPAADGVEVRERDGSDAVRPGKRRPRVGKKT